MRHPLQALALCALVTTGCDRLQDDPIFVYGLAEQRDGAPLAGVTLSYERTLSKDRPSSTGGGAAPFPEPDFTPHGTATTEASGDYFLEIRFGDVQVPDPSYPNATFPYRFRVSRLDEDGSGTFVSFEFYDDVELPKLRPWDARLSVEPGAGGHVVSFAPPPPAPEVPITGEVANTSTPEQEVVPSPASAPEAVLRVSSGGQTLFRGWGATSPWIASPYVLEDFASPEVQLRALSVGEWWFFPLGAAHSYLTFRQEWRTPVLPLPVGNLRPVSRGVPCEPAPEGPCPWTDGRLEQVPVRFTTPQQQWLNLTLPEPTRLRHAVVRGMEGSNGGYFRLEGSLDGEQWELLALSPLGLPERDIVGDRRNLAEKTQWDSPFDGRLYQHDNAHFGESPLADVGPVRYVRLTGTSFANNNNGVGRHISSLAEVSLFE
ncbi:discoidin domain-containing protein [Pyxidicoccus trucidator]|uniref:discoidin domain-containing protein n=1 Tax=Pyxidicoccus trucidator TaxID=2709662 RepID=UPI0013DA9FD8|nr:discoidin domain-containing protein [Pyxidicoccus trucidator]